jgi:ammonia channel protein AmtB
MQERTKDRSAKVIGYALGTVVAGLLIFWFGWKIFNLASLF